MISQATRFLRFDGPPFLLPVPCFFFPFFSYFFLPLSSRSTLSYVLSFIVFHFFPPALLFFQYSSLSFPSAFLFSFYHLSFLPSFSSSPALPPVFSYFLSCISFSFLFLSFLPCTFFPGGSNVQCSSISPPISRFFSIFYPFFLCFLVLSLSMFCPFFLS